MASSTRNKAIELWKAQLPEGDPILLSKILFSYENPPGTKNVAGSQDSLGIVMPCLNYHHYTNDNYWPSEIISIDDESILSWLENHIYLIPLDPRSNSYDVLANTNISKEAAKNFFNTLRIIKNKKFKSISVNKIPNKDLGKAINERLRRAAYYE